MAQHPASSTYTLYSYYVCPSRGSHSWSSELSFALFNRPTALALPVVIITAIGFVGAAFILQVSSRNWVCSTDEKIYATMTGTTNQIQQMVKSDLLAPVNPGGDSWNEDGKFKSWGYDEEQKRDVLKTTDMCIYWTSELHATHYVPNGWGGRQEIVDAPCIFPDNAHLERLGWGAIKCASPKLKKNSRKLARSEHGIKSIAH